MERLEAQHCDRAISLASNERAKSLAPYLALSLTRPQTERSSLQKIESERQEMLTRTEKEAEELAGAVWKESEKERRRNYLPEIKAAQQKITELEAEVGRLKKLLNALERLLIDSGLQRIWERARQIVQPKKRTGFLMPSKPDIVPKPD